MASNLRRTMWPLTLAIVLLAALALRVINLHQRPLWWDEGLSLYFAQQSLPRLFDEMLVTRHTDPPVYLLTLLVWRALLGSTPFVMRLFSALLGVLSVALTWRLARWLTDKKTALLTALFVALSPMQVYYTREVKGYALTIVCALLSTYAWARGLGYADRQPSSMPRQRRVFWCLLYVSSTAAAIGTHYYLALLVLWQGLWVLVGDSLAWMRQGVMRGAFGRSARWCLTAGAAGLVLLPWVLSAFGSTVRGVQGVSAGNSLTLWAYLSQLGDSFGAGPGAEGWSALAAGGSLAALAVVGALQGPRRAFLLIWLVVPLAAAFVIQSFYSFFSPRFLLYLGPVYYLMAARGVVVLAVHISQLSARLALQRGLALFFVAGVLAALLGLWRPGLERAQVGLIDAAQDPRPVITGLQTAAWPDDALVYGYIWQVGYVYSYYAQHSLEFYRADYTPQSVGPELESVFAAHPRLWLLGYQIGAKDMDNLPGAWLEANAYKVWGKWYGPHHLALYLSPDFHTEGVAPERSVARFGGRVELCYPLVDARLRPGDTLALPLRWRALGSIQQDYKVFVHVGVSGMPPLAQSDGRPHNGLSPTNTWSAGREVLDRRALALPLDLPPGRYEVMVGLYEVNGSRLLLDGADGGDMLSLGYVEVAP